MHTSAKLFRGIEVDTNFCKGIHVKDSANFDLPTIIDKTIFKTF